MTTFSFSTGNPANLTGGTAANMIDISGPFTDLRTFINGGNLTDSNVQAAGLTYASLAAVVDSYPKTILEVSGSTGGSVAANTYLLGTGLLTPATTISGAAFRYLDPARYPSGTRAAKLSLTVGLLVNGTGPGTTLTFGLYPIVGLAGGASVVTATLGAVIAGSTVAFASPAANGGYHGETVDFTFPAAAYYGLGVVNSGTTAANSALTWTAALDFRAA